MRKSSKEKGSCVSVLPDEKPPRNVRIPARRPRSARFVGSVSWSWSPAHSRSDGLFLSLDSHRKHWLLWLEWTDDGDSELGVRAYVRCGDTSEIEAAGLLVECWYQREESEYADTGGPWEEVQSGLLSDDDFQAIGERIWPITNDSLEPA